MSQFYSSFSCIIS